MSIDTPSLPLKLAEHVASYINMGIKLPHAIRTPFDIIDANIRRGSFLNRNGGTYRLNRQSLRSSRHRSLLLDEFPYLSPKARKTLVDAEKDQSLPSSVDLICEHVVPCAYMELALRELHQSQRLNGKAVLDFHTKYYRRCIVTKAENGRLRPVQAMPVGWTQQCRVFARYDAAGFEWCKGWT